MNTLFGRLILSHLTCLALLTLSSSLARAEGENVNIIGDPGFEEVNSRAWIFNNWAKVDAEWSFDNQSPHSGTYCKQIVVRQLDAKKNLQIGQFPLPFKASVPYRLTFWMKGLAGPGAVSVIIMQNGIWKIYDTFKAVPTEEWQEYTFDIPPLPLEIEGKIMALLFVINDPMTLWLDDVSLVAQ